MEQRTGVRRWRAAVRRWLRACSAAVGRLVGPLWGDKIEVTGESWYGDDQAARARYMRFRPDEDGLLTYRTAGDVDDHIFLTKDRITIGSSFRADHTVAAPGVAPIHAVFTRRRRDGGGYRYFVDSFGVDTAIRVNGRPLSELRPSDPEGDPGHELHLGDSIVLSGFAEGLSITFRRRAPTSGRSAVPVRPGPADLPPCPAKNAVTAIGTIRPGGN